jgi:hypothetical protein
MHQCDKESPCQLNGQNKKGHFMKKIGILLLMSYASKSELRSSSHSDIDWAAIWKLATSHTKHTPRNATHTPATSHHLLPPIFSIMNMTMPSTNKFFSPTSRERGMQSTSQLSLFTFLGRDGANNHQPKQAQGQAL